jgi:hypothetical protein
MDTISEVRAAAAAVTGAHHRRLGRNGQDAAAAWTGVVAGQGAGAVVVCDGCSAGASSEVGARLGAELVIAAAARELAAGGRASAIWASVHDHVLDALDRMAASMRGDRTRIVHDHFLFTIVAAAYRGDEVAVWAFGDGAYAIGDRVRVLGSFPDNQPPYPAYALLGAAAPSLPQPHVELADARVGSVLVATDGPAEVGLDAFDDSERYLRNPDALRRHLVVLARGDERIDWDGRRVERRAAALQDDGAVALLRWRPRPAPVPPPLPLPPPPGDAS